MSRTHGVCHDCDEFELVREAHGIVAAAADAHRKTYGHNVSVGVVER